MRTSAVACAPAAGRAGIIARGVAGKRSTHRTSRHGPGFTMAMAYRQFDTGLVER